MNPPYEVEFKGQALEEFAIITNINKNLFIEKVGESYLEAILKIQDPSTKILEIDPRYFRPSEVDLLLGDPTKAKTKLGWEPEYNINDLIADMMQSDINLFKRDAYLREGGFTTLIKLF